ncbi:MAG: ImmA/IrrE family metallo-endopeptidase [Bryobacteraceae bacterium]|nr:ImmA/IrrE family metallo-endopeptidase [Bryobacteraceae bacterium]
MAAFAFRFEWEESPRVRAPELSATWARLEIHVNTKVITRVDAERSGSVRTGIYVPLFPIAEWMVSNWFFLWDEWRRDAPQSRHNLLSAREGFALPDLAFHPTESHMELIWRRKAAPYSGLEFLAEGAATVLKAAVREECTRLIEAVVERLNGIPAKDRGIGSRLDSDWGFVKAVLANEAQKEFSERAARLGHDPFAVEEGLAEQIENLGSVLPEPLVDDFCDAIPLGEITSGAETVRSFIESAAPMAQAAPAWEDVLREVRSQKTDTPWRDGYRQASRFRAYLGLNGRTPPDLAHYLSHKLGVFAAKEFAAPSGIDGIFWRFEGRAPVFGIPGSLRDERKRFVIARALGDFLSFGEGSLITHGPTEHQQRNRAFAAEFLAPAHALQNRIRTAAVGEEAIEELAAEFRVSPFVIRHQIQNRRLAALSI